MACNGKRERGDERDSSDDESVVQPIFLECPYCASVFELSDDLECVELGEEGRTGDERRSDSAGGEDPDRKCAMDADPVLRD